jgi:LysM repeat protein
MPRRRSPARWLAPIVLLACVFAVYSIVNANLLSSDEPATPSSSTSSTAAKGKARTVSQRSKSSKRRSRKRRTYTVKSGDTLSSIAVKTGVSLARIQQLNPKLDSNSLQTGQRVKLSP